MQKIYILNEKVYNDDSGEYDYFPLFASIDYKTLKAKKEELLACKKKYNKKAKKKNKVVKFVQDNCKFKFDELPPIKERGMNAGEIKGSSEEIKSIRRQIEAANRAIKDRWQVKHDEWVARYNIANNKYINDFIEANKDNLPKYAIDLLSKGDYPRYNDTDKSKYVIKRISTI